MPALTASFEGWACLTPEICQSDGFPPIRETHAVVQVSRNPIRATSNKEQNARAHGQGKMLQTAKVDLKEVNLR